jgi:hypothetical protein
MKRLGEVIRLEVANLAHGSKKIALPDYYAVWFQDTQTRSLGGLARRRVSARRPRKQAIRARTAKRARLRVLKSLGKRLA